MKIMYGCAIASLLACGVAGAASSPASHTSASTWRVYGSVESFQWKEYLDGDELLKEDGPLFGIGAEVNAPLRKPWEFDGRGRLFFGQVDYDGAIFNPDGSSTPYKSDTVYGGGELEGDFAWVHRASSGLALKPFGGIGLRYWERRLDSQWDSGSVGDYGYVEKWFSLFGMVGLGAQWGSWHGRLAARLPFYNDQTVDLENQGSGEVDLEPGEEVSFSGEVGYDFKKWFADLYFETLEFSESDPDDGTGLFVQPESKAQIVGVRCGTRF